jgi:hypothetical protein
MPPEKLDNKASEEDTTTPEVHLWPEGETVTNGDLRAITDDQAEALLRDATCWSYILREPTGAICCWGQGARKECEDSAIDNAVLWALEAWPVSGMWHMRTWRFALWSPTGSSGRGQR